ncbi:hypothetical protein HZF02_29635 [Pseudomonas yamanorum]|nr:hypothetical protein HZF02_29635 [Pseudomonas yamanorum]
MSNETFDIDKEKPKKIRPSDEAGHAQMLVLETGKKPRFFIATDFVGGLSLIRLLGKSPESLLIQYGHDLPNGHHTYHYPTDGRLQYRDPEDRLYYNVVSGRLDVFVERPQFGTAFKQFGVMENVRFDQDGHVVVLNGTYEVSSD